MVGRDLRRWRLRIVRWLISRPACFFNSIFNVLHLNESINHVASHHYQQHVLWRIKKGCPVETRSLDDQPPTIWRAWVGHTVLLHYQLMPSQTTLPGPDRSIESPGCRKESVCVPSSKNMCTWLTKYISGHFLAFFRIRLTLKNKVKMDNGFCPNWAQRP